MICSPMCTVPVTSSRRRMSSDFEVLVAWPVSWARATPGDTTQRRTSNMAFRTLAMGPPRVRRTSSRCRGLMLVQHRGSAARAAPLRLRGPRQLHPLVRQLVSLLWSDIRNPTQDILVRLPVAASCASKIVLRHEGGQLLTDGRADELVHRHSFSHGDLSQMTMKGVRKTDTERAHLRTPRPAKKGPGSRTPTPNLSAPTKSRVL